MQQRYKENGLSKKKKKTGTKQNKASEGDRKTKNCESVNCELYLNTPPFNHAITFKLRYSKFEV